MLTKINEKLGDKHNKRRTRNVKHVNKAMGTPIGREKNNIGHVNVMGGLIKIVEKN